MRSGIIFTAMLLLMCGNLAAQELVYPTTAQLRTSLQQLTASATRCYSNIDNGPLDASSPDYHAANFHLIPNTRNQLYLAAGPANDSYIEFMAEGINEQQSSTGFSTWKRLFEEALPEFIFLTDDHSTYGESIFYYNKEQTDMFVLEVYYSPVKKTWTLSLSLRHPSEGDKQFIVKKNNPDPNTDIIGQQKAIKETLTALLKARVGKFQSFRSIEMPGKDGATMFLLKGTSYGFDPGPVEFIDVDAAGAATFQLNAAGLQMAQIAVCYANLLTPELIKEGYTITKEETTGNVNYTIDYKDTGVSACRVDKTKGVLTLVILGE